MKRAFWISPGLFAALLASCATPDSVGRAEARARVLGYAQEFGVVDEPTAAHQQLVARTLQRALDGDDMALAQIFTDSQTFVSGDNEGWCKMPWIILCAVGDKRFANFVVGQPAPVQNAAFEWLVGLFGGTEAELREGFPQTAKLYAALVQDQADWPQAGYESGRKRGEHFVTWMSLP